MSKNILLQIIEPIDKFLETTIENGNIWYYVIGVTGIILYLIIW